MFRATRFDFILENALSTKNFASVMRFIRSVTDDTSTLEPPPEPVAVAAVLAVKVYAPSDTLVIKNVLFKSTPLTSDPAMDLNETKSSSLNV